MCRPADSGLCADEPGGSDALPVSRRRVGAEASAAAVYAQRPSAAPSAGSAGASAARATPACRTGQAPETPPRPQPAGRRPCPAWRWLCSGVLPAQGGAAHQDGSVPAERGRGAGRQEADRRTASPPGRVPSAPALTGSGGSQRPSRYKRPAPAAPSRLPAPAGPPPPPSAALVQSRPARPPLPWYSLAPPRRRWAGRSVSRQARRSGSMAVSADAE